MLKKFIQDKNGERLINYCVHCGNDTTQKIIYKHRGSEEVWSIDDEPFTIGATYYFVECGTCEQILIYYKPDYLIDSEFGELIYPNQKELSSSIPEEIRKAYFEAVRISKIAPNAYAVLIRRALEFLCLDKKSAGRSLNEQVNNLAKKGIIPPILAEAIDGLRILGNYGAHATKSDIKIEDVELMDDFFKAVIEYVYIAPGKIDKLKSRLLSLNKKI